jgi:hypothetical protein
MASTVNIRNIIVDLRRILDAYDDGDTADIAAIAPAKKKKKKRQPSAYQIFVGEQMQLPEIKSINPFKERMAVVVMLWKKQKEEDKNAQKETKQPEAK